MQLQGRDKFLFNDWLWLEMLYKRVKNPGTTCGVSVPVESMIVNLEQHLVWRNGMSPKFISDRGFEDYGR